MAPEPVTAAAGPHFHAGQSMLIREFLNWSQQAGAEARADAAGALARAYLYAELDPIDTGDTLRVLTLLLDDSSVLVRRALAESFASAVDAPRHILAALVADRSDIAAIVLERSLVLGDAELIDAVAMGDETSQCAVARRPRLSAAVSGAIAEVASFGAVLAMSRNAGAELTDFAVDRMVSRFGADGSLRETLARREDVGPEMRHAIVVATARALGDFAVGCGWIAPERVRMVLAEACDRATVTIASAEDSARLEQRRFAAYLRSSGYLTPALILRGLLSGNLAMFKAVLCELSGQPEKRVGAFLCNPGGLGFAALYRSTGLPDGLLAAFRAALAVATGGDRKPGGEDRHLDQRMVEHVIETCETAGGQDMDKLTVLLRRFEAEAARDEARAGLGPLPTGPLPTGPRGAGETRAPTVMRRFAA